MLCLYCLGYWICKQFLNHTKSVCNATETFDLILNKKYISHLYIANITDFSFLIVFRTVINYIEVLYFFLRMAHNFSFICIARQLCIIEKVAAKLLILRSAYCCTCLSHGACAIFCVFWHTLLIIHFFCIKPFSLSVWYYYAVDCPSPTALSFE